MEIGSFTFGGLASGIDSRALIDAILTVERQPIVRLQDQQGLLNQRKSAFDDLRGKLNDFLTTLRDLSADRTFRGRVTTLTDESFFTATAGTSAERGLFSVEVFDLAAAHKVKSNGLAASDQSLVTAGTITIQSGSNDPIDIVTGPSTGNDTLAAVRDAINDADAGVQASILFDGTDYQLVVRAEETGVDNALTISDSSNLGLDQAGNLVTAAADARIEVDGIEVTSSTNRISNVISGVAFDLLARTEGQAVTLEVGNDVDGAVEAVQSLVEKYNEAISFFNEQFDQESPGPLAGDGFSRRLQTTLQTLVTGGVDGIPFGGIRSLSSIGVSFDGRSGEMSLDAGKLRELLDERFDEVGDLFLKSGRASDPRIRFLGAADTASSGEFAVEVTQAAEQATLLGSFAVKPGGIKKDETLTITVGADIVNVNLLKGDTVGDIVTKINDAFGAAEIDATASDDAGALRLTTNAFGASQSLTVVSDQNAGGGNQAGFSTSPTTDVGQDVAGLIGGVAATGNGQVLTSSEELGAISIRVRATAADIAATGGDFGTVSFSAGLTQALKAQLTEVTRFGDGQIDATNEIIERQLDRLSDEIRRLEERLVGREARLVRSFTAAEQAIALLQSQQSQLGSFFPAGFGG